MPDHSDQPEAQIISLDAERKQRIHDLNDQRLEKVKKAFELAMPMKQAAGIKKSSKKKKSRKK